MLRTHDTAHPQHPINTGEQEVTTDLEPFQTADGDKLRMLYTAWVQGAWVSKHLSVSAAREALDARKA